MITTAEQKIRCPRTKQTKKEMETFRSKTNLQLDTQEAKEWKR